MANAWFRMYSEFATDAKVQIMPEHMQRRLMMLFCLRSCDVLVTFCDDDLAFQLRITADELEETKQLFIRKGFINSDWEISNWDKRQFISDSSSHRTKAYRERKKNVTETSQERHSDALDTDTDTEQIHKKKRVSTATRLPIDWQPSETDYLFAKQERPEINPRSTADQFRDYWIAKSGKDATKADWSATWRNWVRRQTSTPSKQSYESSADKTRKTIEGLTGRVSNEQRDFIDIN